MNTSFVSLWNSRSSSAVKDDRSESSVNVAPPEAHSVLDIPRCNVIGNKFNIPQNWFDFVDVNLEKLCYFRNCIVPKRPVVLFFVRSRAVFALSPPCRTPRASRCCQLGPSQYKDAVLPVKGWIPILKIRRSRDMGIPISGKDGLSQIAKFMGPTWGLPGSCRPQNGPMLAPGTLLSGLFWDRAQITYDKYYCLRSPKWFLLRNPSWHQQE